jgi:hypothetical protein
MRSDHQTEPGRVRAHSWRRPELDAATAEALAVVTLYASGSEADAALAGRLLDELTAAPDGDTTVIGGLVSVCSALLVLLEYQGGPPPDLALHQVGQLISQAVGSAGG